MANKTVRRLRADRRGFTLIELLVVVLIIGILAAIAVPQYFRVVEKGRVSEAISYVHSIKGSEERALLKGGVYVVASGLDITPAAPKAYTAGAITPVGSTSWQVQLTRLTAVPTYGQYVVTYNSVTQAFVCSGGTNAALCQNDLMP